MNRPPSSRASGGARDREAEACIPDASFENDAPEFRQRLLIEETLPLGLEPDPSAAAMIGKRDAERNQAIIDGCGNRLVFQKYGNDVHAGPPRFRPNNPFWIDNVRASVAARVTMNSAKRLLKR